MNEHQTLDQVDGNLFSTNAVMLHPNNLTYLIKKFWYNAVFSHQAANSEIRHPLEWKEKDMKYRNLAVVLILAFFVKAAVAQDEWDKYLPRTLNQVTEQHEKAVLENKGFYFTADTFPSRVNVIYTGEVKKLSAERKEFIVEYFKSRGLGNEIPDLFESEMLFKEGSVEYWLPVQKQVLPYFAKELKKNDKVVLFIIWIGAKNKSGKIDWIFLINEFEK